MFALVSCLALLSVATGVGLSQRAMITPLRTVEPPYQPQQITCRETIQVEAATVCGMCGAKTAYFVLSGKVQSLNTIVDADTYLLLLTSTSDISARLPPANFTIAGDSSRLCIAVSQMDGRPDFLSTFQYFGGMQQADLAVPEIFKVQGETYFQHMAVGVVYQESQLVYDAVDFLFLASARAELTKNITLSLDRIQISSLNRSYTASYTGMTELRGARVPFAIVGPYGRQPGWVFRANIAVANAYNVRDWLTFTSPASDCLALQVPAGISAIFSAPVQFSAFDFVYSEKKKKALLSEIVTFFGIPSFAYGPGMFLERPTAEYQVDSEGKCTLLVSGRVDVGFPMQAVVISQGGAWYVSGGIAPPIESITPRQVERTLPGFFPVTSQSLFPQYATSMVDLSALLRDRAIADPRIRFFYTPSLYINIIGRIAWDQGREAQIQIMVGAVDDVIESVVTIEQPTSSATLPGDSDISTGDLTTVLSTGYVNLTRYPYMTGERTDNVTEWLVGTYAFATITRAKNCQSPFCDLLAEATPQRSFSLSGNLIGATLSLRGRFVNYQLAQGVSVYENDVVLEFVDQELTLYLQGAFYIRSDSTSVNRFSVNVTDASGNAAVSARLENTWESVFDIPTIFISSLTITGTADPSVGLNATADGLALIGAGCYTPWDGFDMNYCILGRVSVSLDPLDYQRNALTVRINTMRTTSLLRYIVGSEVYEDVEIPVALRGLNVSQSIDLRVTYSPDSSGNRVVVTGNVRYFGVQGWMQARMPSFAAGKVGITVDLNEFTLAQENVFISADSSGRIRLEVIYDSREANTRGAIEAGVAIWGISADSQVEVTNEGARLTTRGRPFIGLYYLTVQILSETWTDLRTSAYKATGRLAENDLLRISWNVRQDLLYWVAQGTDALTTAMNWANNATMLAAAADNQECEDRQCPVSPLCRDFPDTECATYQQSQSCDSGKPVCSSPEPTCAEYAETCILSTTTCSDTEEDQCVLWNTECEETMNVCTQWTQACTDSPIASCGTYAVLAAADTCLEYRTSCVQEPRQDSSCVSSCLQSQGQASFADSQAANYTAALASVNTVLGAFRTINSLLPLINYNIFSVASISLDTQLDAPGIGENDVMVRVVYQTISLSSLQLETAEVTLNWDFQQEVMNEVRLLRAAKEFIVSSLEEALDPRLDVMTPFEVLIEQFYQT